MPAAFFILQKNDIFKSVGAAQHLIKIPKVEDIIGAENIAIYNSASITLNETIQYFMSFDDVIKFIHFGKGLGTLAVDGAMFSDKDGGLPGFKKYIAAVSELRGKEQDIVLGDKTFTVVMTNSQFSIMSEPDTMAQFSFNFAIVNHDL